MKKLRHVAALTVVASASLTMPVVLQASKAAADGYTVRDGDTLTSLAKKFSTTRAELYRKNPALKSRPLLREGANLAVPAQTRANIPLARAIAYPPPISPATYVVAKGDTAVAVAAQLGTTVDALAKGNHLRHPERLQIGLLLNKPGKTYSKLPRRFRTAPERLVLMGYFDRAAARFQVPPELLKSLAWVESGWQPGVVSDVGAIGIGQLMPATTKEVADELRNPTLDSWDPVENVTMTAYYLRSLLDRFHGDVNLAAAAYYQGHGSVTRHGVSEEGATYAKAVLWHVALFTADEDVRRTSHA